jgi:hypothetical protein
MDDNAYVVVTNELLTASIRITKKISNYNTELQQSVFWFLVEGPNGYSEQIKIAFSEEDVESIGFGSDGKSTVLSNLYPGEYTVKELPCIGYELIAANTEDTEVSEDSGRISFSTTLTLTVTAQEESNAYFWNSVKEEPEYTINNTVRFDENGNMILENTRSEAE